MGSIAIPKIAESPKQENDGFVRLGVDLVFHLDVLKPWMPKAAVSDGASGANTKKQMSLELDDWW
ncbi:hypothetical protein [Paraburkholderia caffeinilytica]|uniref:Uncharacterized protein n=1 Tax=Paraburkholderia caffeinilytica TaxID=1761016 RepID=A0ABQ1LNS6_9BURK|nr:hypothetical protein [Paraburkholderia caffeinilytica]GGC27434.1 hypothetical protein GCM10011400_12300 [Paraburkholderia caffeinilytica]CAB3780257.1 hypothetical protein LMG28690_00911 [Paraburkholderia caffeinilytica]